MEKVFENEFKNENHNLEMIHPIKQNANKQSLLEVKGLNMHFNVRGVYKKVLDNIYFDVKEGDFFGIIGESGSGKTTIGKTIIKLYQSTGGVIEFDKQLISQKKLSREQNRWMRKNIQMIFQDPMSSMNPIKNIYKIVSEPLIINKIASHETKVYMFKIHSVNKYFKNIFQTKNKQLLTNFEIEYYSTLIKDYQKMIKKCLKYKSENIDSLSYASEIVDSILNELIDRLQDNLEKSYTLLDDQKKLIDATFKIFDDNINISDLTSRQEFKYKNLKKLFKKSKELEEFDNYVDECNETIHKLKNNAISQIEYDNGYKNVVLAKIFSDLKLYKQSKELSKNEISFKYFELLEIKTKQIKLILTSVFKLMPYLNKKEMEEIIEFVETLLNDKYNATLTSLLNKEREYKNHDVSKRIEILESLKEFDEIINYAKSNSKYLNSEFNQNTINEIKRRYFDVQEERIDYIRNEPKKIKYQIQSSFMKLWNKKSQIDFNENKINYTFDDIFALKSQAKSIISEFKKVIVDLLDTISAKEIEKCKGFIAKYKVKSKIKTIRDSLNPKWKTQSAITYEFNNSIKRFKINSILYGTNWFTGLFVYPFIKNNIVLEKVYDALRCVGLKHEHAYRYPHEFSGGQRQRIVIARALITKPKLIIADEPISALDVSIQSQVVNIMRKLAKEQNVTFLFIAHDLSMVSYACNRVIIMHNGKIVEKGNVKSIFNNPIHPYTKSLFKAVPELSRIHVDLASFNENMDYDKEYNLLNQPQFFNVDNNDHLVFATNDQIQKWINSKE